MAYQSDPVPIEMVEEAMAIYLTKPNNVGNAIEHFFHNKLKVSQIIAKGLSYSFFEKIQHLLSFTESDWADYLNLSPKTLQRSRKAEGYVFKPIHSEKILEMVELATRGESVFGSLEKFSLWLNTPSLALGSKKPFDLLKDSYGQALILEELNRIEHGIFA